MTLQSLTITWIFQSTLPRGERPNRKTYMRVIKIFQSTLPRGERLVGKLTRSQNGKFQSTLPRGERQQGTSSSGLGVFISIHAPTRGATTHFYNSMQFYYISIHAPTRGATPYYTPPRHLCQISIHAPTRGATMPFFKESKYIDISIHAPTRGATSILPKFYTLLLSKITNFIFTLHHLFITAVYSKKIFVHYFGCESLDIFMYACHSHLHYIIRISSAAIPRSIPTCSTFVLYLFPK